MPEGNNARDPRIEAAARALCRSMWGSDAGYSPAEFDHHAEAMLAAADAVDPIRSAEWEEVMRWQREAEVRIEETRRNTRRGAMLTEHRIRL